MQEREELTRWSYFPTFSLWAAFNTNILTVSDITAGSTKTYHQFSEGLLGPALFGLDLKTSVLCIVFFTAISCLPPAYLATNGPRTGMRQMIQGRYALGCVESP